MLSQIMIVTIVVLGIGVILYLMITNSYTKECPVCQSMMIRAKNYRTEPYSIDYICPKCKHKDGDEIVRGKGLEYHINNGNTSYKAPTDKGLKDVAKNLDETPPDGGDDPIYM